MSDPNAQLIVRQPSAATSPALPVPTPRADVRVRLATLDDVPFMDSLQKLHARQLGYFPTKQFEGYVGMGAVLIAEEGHEGTQARRHEGAEPETASVSDPSVPSCLRASVPPPLGYLISRDRYLKRDELGVVYQLCVVPDARRGLIGATLLKAAFDRSAYGCKLYCCWCAQDLAANYFWESMGFVPVAFRGGSDKKNRVHIFWQKRIRAGDTTTPWWFPAKTEGGAMREDRLVLPIPPGLHWSDPMPVLRSDVASDVAQAPRLCPDAEKQVTGEAPVLRRRGRTPPAAPPVKPAPPALAGFGFMSATPPAPTPAAKAARPRPAVPSREKPKADPKAVALARELRDRWLEAVNDDASLLLPAPKYDVARALPATGPRPAAGVVEARVAPMPLLPAA